MVFSFGNTSTPFGTQQQGFGSGFSSTPATQPGFGTFSSGFGAPSTQASPFGGATFGSQPAVATTAPVFGSSFQTPAATATPAFGSTSTTSTLFGQSTPQARPLFGQSAPATPAPFGQTAASTPSLFGQPAAKTANVFGQAAATTAATPSLFSQTTKTGSAFGQTAATPLFGQQSTAGQSLFGQPTTTTTQSLFGQPGIPSTGLFGSSNTGTGFGTGLFNAAATTTTGGTLFFQSPFGAGATPSVSFGGFSGFPTAPSLNSLTNIHKPTNESKVQQYLTSVYAVNIFNDERDDVIRKWNLLQACWGVGKGYFNPSQPPVEYSPENPFFRFKTLCYNLLPDFDNSDGIVRLVFDKKIDDLKNQQDALRNGIAAILGNKPNLNVSIYHIRPLSDTQTAVKIFVSEKSITGSFKKIPATDLASFLTQPAQYQQLKNSGINWISPYVRPTKAQFEEYYKNPPPGIDPQIWQAALADNPDPSKLVPVPLNGFSELHLRYLYQERVTGLHLSFLEKVKNDMNELKQKRIKSIAKIKELTQTCFGIQHRIIRIIVKQECKRNNRLPIQPKEVSLYNRLEAIKQELDTPHLFKGPLSEILANITLIDSESNEADESKQIDGKMQEVLQQFLKTQYAALNNLVDIINNDWKTLSALHKRYVELNAMKSREDFDFSGGI